MNAPSSISPRSFAQLADLAIFAAVDEVEVQLIVGIHAVGADAQRRLEHLALTVLEDHEVIAAAVLLFVVQRLHQRSDPGFHLGFIAEIAFVQRRLVDQAVQQRAR